MDATPQCRPHPAGSPRPWQAGSSSRRRPGGAAGAPRTAPTTGGYGVLALDRGTGILTYKNISYGSSTTTAISTTTSAIALSTGWNLISWEDNPKSVSSAVTDSVVSVYGWNPITQTWRGWFKAGVDVPGANDLPEFETGGVYWIYSAVTGSLQ